MFIPYILTVPGRAFIVAANLACGLKNRKGENKKRNRTQLVTCTLGKLSDSPVFIGRGICYYYRCSCCEDAL